MQDCTRAIRTINSNQEGIFLKFIFPPHRSGGDSFSQSLVEHFLRVQTLSGRRFLARIEAD